MEDQLGAVTAKSVLEAKEGLLSTNVAVLARTQDWSSQGGVYPPSQALSTEGHVLAMQQPEYSG